jgi:hypothetical protein
MAVNLSSPSLITRRMATQWLTRQLIMRSLAAARKHRKPLSSSERTPQVRVSPRASTAELRRAVSGFDA